MNDNDRQELDVLRKQLTMLHTQAHQRDHELMALRVHSHKQDIRHNRLLALVGLLDEDLEQLTALTPADKSLLLRIRRPEN